MNDKKFRNAISEILEYDKRYSSDAYEFISDAVHYTCAKLKKRKKPKCLHITGHELVKGVSDYAREQFGPMAYEVMKNWGITDPLAVGNVVFNMVDQELLYTSDNDSIQDFMFEMDFKKTLQSPFSSPSRSRKYSKPPIIA